MNTREQMVETEALVERLCAAHRDSQQRALGSNLFEEAADCIEALAEAVDALSEIIEERK